MLQSTIHGIRRALGLALVSVSLLTGCSSGATSALAPQGSKSSASPGTQPTAASTGQPASLSLPTASQSGTVVLPAGSGITPSSLTALNSLGHTSIASNGSFSLTTFSGGPQLTTIVDKNGNPLLIGWLGPASTTIDVNSTAAVLLFYASDSFALTADLRAEALTLIPSAPGLSTLASAIGNAIASNPDTFATTNAAVSAALQTLLASLIQTSSSTNATRMRLHTILTGSPFLKGYKTMGVHFTAVNTPTPGLTPIIDFPDGFHFLNELRRPADVFIDRISFADAAGTHSDPGSLTPDGPLNIPATAGVQGGTVSTLVDIINGTYAYSPITTSSTPLPLVPNSTSTLYALTVVGPGLLEGAFDQISTPYQDDSNNLAVKFMVTDFLLPLIVSQVIPSSNLDETLEAPGVQGAIADLVTSLAAVPSISAASSSGDTSGALALATTQVASANSTSAHFLQGVLDQILLSQGIAAQQRAFEATQAYFNGLGMADRIEEAFDASVVFKELATSNRADVYQVIVTPDTVTLIPANQTIVAGFDGTLLASVPAAGSSGVTLGYTYTNTALFGHLFDGQPGHEDNFMSSSATVTYVANANVGKGGTDTIGVAIADVDAGNRTQIGTADATVHVVPSPAPTPPMLSVSISPFGCTTIPIGGATSYTASAAPAPPQGESYEYGWQFGTSGGVPPAGVTFTDPGSSYEPGIAEFVGPSSSVGLSTRPSSGANGNVSIKVQLFVVDGSGNVTATNASAGAFFSDGGLQCAQ
jgi:hypothetical protein